MNKRIRQAAGALLCLALFAGLIPTGAFADQPITPHEEMIVFASQKLDTTELEEQYVYELFYGKTPSLYALHGNNDVKALTPGEQEFFDQLLAQVEKVAAEGGSTSLKVSGTALTQELSAPTMEQVQNLVSVCCRHVDQMLKSSHPELLYWCGYGGAYSWSASMYAPTKSNGNYSLASINFSYQVASNYRATADDTHTVDASRIQRAIQAKENAQRIAQKIASNGKTPLEQLRDMKNIICDLTDYNVDALDQDAMREQDLGDPWQLVGVFDNDPATKVVCEGYSKAFQYLCDLVFPKGNPECFLVTGLLNAGGSSGGHMWNLVRMDGKSYLVDVTNCDIPNAPAKDSLFMVSPANASVTTKKYAEDYIVLEQVPGYLPQSVEFIYSENTRSLYSQNLLALADNLSHNWSDWKTVTDPTCTTPGKESRTCSLCNWVQERTIAPLGHDLIWKNDKTNHWQVCSRCGEVSNKAAHTFGDWNVVTEATETAEGLEERTCSVCNHKENRVIPAVVRPTVKVGWTQVENGWKYMTEQGTYHIGWLQLNDTWYYCDENEMMLTGWHNIGTGRFYFNQWGHMAESCWEMIDGKFYYFDQWGHSAIDCWQEVDGIWYRFDSNGQMVTGWQYVDGNWYYFDVHGAMLTGWNYIASNWFYMDEAGHMLTGWQYISGNWYYFNEWGQMATDWQYIGDTWYYMDQNGHMLTGWQWIGGNCYYFYNSGAMAANTWIDGSYVNGSGVWVA